MQHSDAYLLKNIRNFAFYMKKIVVATDSFKGCLDSREAGEACRCALEELFPQADIIVLPVADGGEGTVEAMCEKKVTCHVADPLGRTTIAEYGVRRDCAVIELAAASGLALLSPTERNPLITNTYGFGQMIQHAIGSGYRRFIIGLGGSATCDGGTGMLQAMGFDLGVERACGGDLCRISPITRPKLPDGLTFEIACDVDNPFYGPQGAACVFAPQKGASPSQVAVLDEGLRHWASVIKCHTGRDVQDIPGAGAAGGVAGAMSALLGAELKPGAKLVLSALHFSDIIQNADLIITGEGAMDSQTLHGKLPMGVLDMAKEIGVPVVAIAGKIEDRDKLLAAGFTQLIQITPPRQPLGEAMRPDVARANIIQALNKHFRL